MSVTGSLGYGPFTRIAVPIAALAVAVLTMPSDAQSIYSCIDSKGRRITSDRPVPECLHRDQRILNSDGSVKAVLPPSVTAEERAEQEAREKKKAAEEVAREEALRRDRNLLRRFPDQESHQKARAAALSDLRKSVERSERRLAELAAERKPLEDEAEFYKATALPSTLRQQLDANDASVDAQRTLVQNQQSEMVRINAHYDMELSRLKRLWSGAAPGSLGPLTAPAAVGATTQAPQESGQSKLSPVSSSAAR